ncbi:MAG: response regulator [Bacteroidetes bacterium]|nr:response regulator [Bacteroidota bacterium]
MDEEFLLKLREAFAIEADEHCRTISKGLADLEQAVEGETQPLLDMIFREAHSLKGAARAVNRGDVEALCQAMEGVFSIWKKDAASVLQEHFATLGDALVLLDELLASDDERSPASEPLATCIENIKQLISANRNPAGSASPPPCPFPEQRVDRPLPEYAKTASSNDGASSSASPQLAPPLSAMKTEPRHPSVRTVGAGTEGAVSSSRDTIRVPVSELEALYRQTEELTTVKFMIGRSASDLKLIVEQCREWLREYQKHRQQSLEKWDSIKGTVRDTAYFIDQYERLLHFVKWSARQIEGMQTAVVKGIEDGRSTMYVMESMSDSMLDQAKQLLLLPFAILTDTLHPMVRKLARDLEKRVRFTVQGEDIRIDKRILEALKDPMVHLLRNSLDHGIEDAGTRREREKPEEGNIRITISITRDNRIEVRIEDDGGGIDVEAVRQKAVQEGIVSSEEAEALTDRAVLDLIFHSGLSTSQIITDISGRGIGLSVVRENISALGGEIEVRSKRGEGSVFILSLPTSLSNARGVLVRSSGRMYIVPLQHVERGFMMHRENYSELDGIPVINHGERIVTVQRLENILQVPSVGQHEESSNASILLLKLGSELLGVEVDEILWEQDVVVKPLPPPVSRVISVAGASLLGTGELVPVLHIPDIFEMARRTFTHEPIDRTVAGERASRKLLIVDDSITSRVLLHDILMSSGYKVLTAVDGIDALTSLREEDFDLVVTDVEMPRMNGFELTESIRRDEKLHTLPVILVTGLESPEDRERGFDVGADAYIIKSSFDQSNLIEVIERLL